MRKMVSEFEQEMESAEKMQFQGGGGGPGFGARTTPDVDGSRGMGGFGGEASAAGAAAGGSKLSGALGGGGAMAGAAVLGTVALGGTLASRMLGAMSDASGRLRATTSMLDQAMSLFWKPFGDLVGNALQPYAEDALKAMVDLNQLISEEGLAVALPSWIQSSLNNLPEALGKARLDSFEGTMEALVGDFELGDLMDDEITSTDIIAALAFPSIGGPALLDSIGWPDIGASNTLNMIGWPTIAANPLLAMVSWPAIGTGAMLGMPSWPTINSGNILSQIDWPSINAEEIIDAVFGSGDQESDGDDGGSTGGDSGGTDTGSSTTGETNGSSTPPVGNNDGSDPNRGIISRGVSEVTDTQQRIEVMLETSERRLGEVTASETNRYFDMIGGI